MIGRRFTESEGYKRAVEDGWTGELPSGIQLLSREETMQELRLRTYADLTPFEIEGVPYPGELAFAANVPALVETIPVKGIQVYLGEELSETAEAGPANDGQPLPEEAFNFGTFAGTPTKLPRFGSAAPVSLATLDEQGIVESVIERRVRYGFPLGLEKEILTGSGGFWTGITQLATNATGDSTHAVAVAKGAGYRCDAITNAIAAVQSNGWYHRKLQVISSPTTRAATYTERDSSLRPLDATAMFDDQITGWYVSKYLTAGSAIVADLFGAIALLLRDGIEIDLAREHSDFLARGLVEMTLATRAYSWIRQPAAIAIVTGL